MHGTKSPGRKVSARDLGLNGVGNLGFFKIFNSSAYIATVNSLCANIASGGEPVTM